MEKNRCDWLTQGKEPEEIYVNYHDMEWGVPVREDRLLFESLILEGAQAGLSWITILKKRENYRLAYDNFDISLVAKYDDNKKAELLNNAGIVRNKLKISSSILNAQKTLLIQEEYGSLSNYLWSFVNNEVIQNSWTKMSEMPSSSKESDNMSKDLRSRGFKFVGSTICYSFMQAVGMVNDHTIDCFRNQEL